jgi:hypothetical protein
LLKGIFCFTKYAFGLLEKPIGLPEEPTGLLEDAFGRFAGIIRKEERPFSAG